ncbi:MULTISPECIES: hypothetical protein [unclassified Microcoleus]|uniref:hypothetical protein n=1 Tax=unclassified Microcoleus TaxID=2642155 RepID=UPI002FD22D26
MLKSVVHQKQVIADSSGQAATVWDLGGQPASYSGKEYSRLFKERSLMSKLQAPDKEATVRFTVDMSESLHRKLSMLAAKTRSKKVDLVRMLLEDGLKE